MSEIVKLSEVKGKPHEGLIPLLEDVMTLARDGKLVNLALVAEGVNGNIITGKSFNLDKSNLYAIIGALSVLHAEFMGMVEQPEDRNY